VRNACYALAPYLSTRSLAFCAAVHVGGSVVLGIAGIGQLVMVLVPQGTICITASC